MGKNTLTPEEKRERADGRHALAFNAKNVEPKKKAGILAALAALQTIEGRVLSEKNKVMLYLQAQTMGFTPTKVGGFAQWRKVGRSVKVGAKGMQMCFPMEKTEEKDDGTTTKSVHFSWTTVWDETQTAPVGTAGAGGEDDTIEKHDVVTLSMPVTPETKAKSKKPRWKPTDPGYDEAMQRALAIALASH